MLLIFSKREKKSRFSFFSRILVYEFGRRFVSESNRNCGQIIKSGPNMGEGISINSYRSGKKRIVAKSGGAET